MSIFLQNIKCDDDMEETDIKPNPYDPPNIPDTMPSLQIQDVRSLTDTDSIGETQSSLLGAQPSILKPHTSRTNQTLNPLKRMGEKSSFLKRLGTSNKSLYEEYLRFKVKHLQPKTSKDERIIITPTKYKDGKVQTVKGLYKEGTIAPVIINTQDEEADFMDWHLNIHNQKQQEHGKRIKLNDPLPISSVKPQLSVVNDTEKVYSPSLVSIQQKAESCLGKPPRIGINFPTPQTSNSNPINTVTLPPPTIVTLRTQPAKCYGKTTSPTIITSTLTQTKETSLTQLKTSSTATVSEPFVEGLPNNFNPIVKLTRINEIAPDISNSTSISTTSTARSPIFVTAYSKPPILLTTTATSIPSSSTASSPIFISNPRPSTSKGPMAKKLIERVDNAIKNNIQILMGKKNLTVNNSKETANNIKNNCPNIMRKTLIHTPNILREKPVKNNQISTRNSQNESSLQLKPALKASISIPPPQLPSNLIGSDTNNMSQYIKQIQQTISAIQKITKTPEIKTTSLPEAVREKVRTQVPPVPVKTFRDKATMAKDRGVIRSFQSRLSRLKRKNDLLKAKVKVLQRQVNQKQKPLYEQADRLEKLKEEGNTQAIFLLEQIQNFEKKSVIYSMESMTIFTVLYKRSQKGYNFLQHYNILGMPSRTTVRRFIEKDGNFQDRAIDEHLDD